jgi:phospholipid transport system substrate-binding protein
VILCKNLREEIMFKYRFWLGIFGLFLMIAISVPVMAGAPTERIKETTDKIIAIVSDPALKSPDKKAERKRLIRQAIDERFNWEEMSRRTLARHWRERTEDLLRQG